VRFLKAHEELCRESDDQVGLANGLGLQALIAKAQGRLEEALRLFKQQETIFRMLGASRNLAPCLAIQASIIGLSLGRRNEAVLLAEEALRICSQAGPTPLANEVQNILNRVRGSGR
jgi:tetratricopeptide (TPR) repeat protein